MMNSDCRNDNLLESPEYVQTSTAAAMTLGLYPGKFHRGAKLKALNLLLTYPDGCKASCAYCGLSRNRIESERTFIRVDWPTFRMKEILGKLKENPSDIHRVCISMITHKKAFEDLLTVARTFKNETKLSISALISPTLIKDKKMLEMIKESGVDMVGIAVDGATPGIFDSLRGKGVQGPHKWEKYWDNIEDSVDIFGRSNVSVHLVVGLGETEKEMIETVQKAHDLGAESHLFSFYPEPGSQMEGSPRPGIPEYHRVQLARYLIFKDMSRFEKMDFDSKGRITEYGVGKRIIDKTISEGEAFMTSGCRGNDGKTACNRPYGNERPSEHLRNFPFEPNENDIAQIKDYLYLYS